MDCEAVRGAVGLRLGLNLCEPQTCSCGSLVDATGVHAFVCKQAAARTVRHYSLNDLIARAMSSAHIPVCKEPPGLTRTDGRRPGGLFLIPWQSGKAVVRTMADSYLHAASTGGGEVAKLGGKED